MASLLSRSLAEAAKRPPAQGASAPCALEQLIVVDFGESGAADFAANTVADDRRSVALVTRSAIVLPRMDPLSTVKFVVFLGRRWTSSDDAALDQLVAQCRQLRVGAVAIVSSFRAHLGDPVATRIEKTVRERLHDLNARVIAIRPGHVLSPHSRTTLALRRFSFLAPLVPARFAGCFVTGAELFRAIKEELNQPSRHHDNEIALFGINRSWRAIWRTSRAPGWWPRLLEIFPTILATLGLGQVLGFLALWLMCWTPRLRHWHVSIIRPQSHRELLAIYNRYNFRHVKLVGYNNGIVHFGHRYPGKTIVSTVGCGSRARVNGRTATFDAGLTLRHAIDAIRPAGKEFKVLPNYTYVSVGTSFFVPIHGSASACSTLAESIERVLLYDPVQDRFIGAKRGSKAFGRYLYNLSDDVLLLRLRFELKENSSYAMERQRLHEPTSDALLKLFRDSQASNVEVRKSRAASTNVDVFQYYAVPPSEDGVLATPRDSLGSLWDRLEENPFTRWPFHALTRWFLHHAELFFTAEEFDIFWQTHRTLPLAKIQLRYIHRDGYPHSPFRDTDRISADLVMLRRHRAAFDAYLKETFHAVKLNPGKHSM